MKTLIALCGMSLCFYACATPKKTIISEEFTRTFESIDATTAADFSKEDKNIRIEYTPDTILSVIPIKIFNKSKETVKILWDESAFLNAQLESERIIHEGVKIKDRDKSMSPSIIAPGSSLADSVGPSSRSKWAGRHWSRSPICGRSDMISEKDATRFTWNESDCIGKTFGLLITYEVLEKKNSLTLKYKYVNRVLKTNTQQTP